MSTLSEHQAWYLSNCDGDWEHSWSVEIGTLDNPGWRVKIDLTDTKLADVPFEERKHNYDDDRDWYRCWKSANVWEAAGGPENLEAMLGIFLAWAKENAAV